MGGEGKQTRARGRKESEGGWGVAGVWEVFTDTDITTLRALWVFQRLCQVGVTCF